MSFLPMALVLWEGFKRCYRIRDTDMQLLIYGFVLFKKQFLQTNYLESVCMKR